MGTLTVNSGTYDTSSGSNGANEAIFNWYGAKSCTINGGTFKGYLYGLQTYEGTTYINAGSFSGAQWGIMNSGGMTYYKNNGAYSFSGSNLNIFGVSADLNHAAFY